MTVDQPQEQHLVPGHPERVEGEWEVGPAREAERVDEQRREPYHSERVEDETDGVAAQERDHPERIEDETDGVAAEHPTMLEDRDAGVGRTTAGVPTTPPGDFRVFGPGELEGYRSRWESIQLGFLDDPKGAAEEADTVVGELLGRLTARRQALSDELNRQSEQDVYTESMRLAVRNYRSLFRRLIGS